MVKKRSKKVDRLAEVCDTPKALERKCKQLARMIQKSRCTVVFTGAGISTAASIPDYRGPNGIWTLADKGKKLDQTVHSTCNPANATPTRTHMALRELYARGFVRHILSQNCDGLHLRSGLPQNALSEIHGNMYVEVCTHCQPNRQYIRAYDTTCLTKFRRHQTGRRCDVCNHDLIDSIVHFGEWGKLEYPLNWKGATTILQSDACDLIIVLGSSLKILNKYEFLWPDREQRRSRKLAIVNLQWTPKDRSANLKINAYCDAVMDALMSQLELQVPLYCSICDPVLTGRRRNAARAQRLMETINLCTCSSSTASSSTSTTTDPDNVPLSRLVSQTHQSPSISACSTPSTFCESSTTTNIQGGGWWSAGFALKMAARRKIRYKGYSGRRKRRRMSTVDSISIEETISSADSSCNATTTSSAACSDHDESWSSDDDLPLSSIARPSTSTDSQPPSSISCWPSTVPDSPRWQRIDDIIDIVVKQSSKICIKSEPDHPKTLKSDTLTDLPAAAKVGLGVSLVKPEVITPIPSTDPSISSADPPIPSTDPPPSMISTSTCSISRMSGTRTTAEADSVTRYVQSGRANNSAISGRVFESVVVVRRKRYILPNLITGSLDSKSQSVDRDLNDKEDHQSPVIQEQIKEESLAPEPMKAVKPYKKKAGRPRKRRRIAKRKKTVVRTDYRNAGVAIGLGDDQIVHALVNEMVNIVAEADYDTE